MIKLQKERARETWSNPKKKKIDNEISEKKRSKTRYEPVQN